MTTTAYRLTEHLTLANELAELWLKHNEEAAAELAEHFAVATGVVVCQWFFISNALVERALRLCGEVVIACEQGAFWGRTSYGREIVDELDEVARVWRCLRGHAHLPRRLRRLADGIETAHGRLSLDPLALTWRINGDRVAPVRHWSMWYAQYESPEKVAEKLTKTNEPLSSSSQTPNP